MTRRIELLAPARSAEIGRQAILHASTQCDIRTPAKVRFLADCGFSRLVLARELSLKEIAAVRATSPTSTTARRAASTQGTACKRSPPPMKRTRKPARCR